MARRFSIESVFKAVDNISAPVSRMQNRLGKFTRRAGAGFDKLNRKVSKITRAIGGMAARTVKFGGAVLGALGAATVVALNKTADAADYLAKQARRLMFPIEELQEWKFVAEQSGISNELLDKSLGAFSKRLGEAKAGTGPLVSGLKNLNPQLLEQLTNAKNVSDAFGLYINAMRKSDSATEKAALANAAFSRSGLQLVNIADNSAAAIKAMRIEQQQNGNITKKQAEDAEAYNDAANSLKKTLLGLMRGVLLPMMPTLTTLLRQWREWIVANKEMLQQRIMQFFTDMKDRVLGLVKAVVEFSQRYDLGERIAATLDTLGQFSNFLGENGGMILKVAAGITALVVVLQTLTGVLTLVNLVMAANPIGLIVVGVAALIAGFTALVVWIDDIVEGFDSMPAVLQAVLAPIGLIIKAIKFVKDNIGTVTSVVAKIGRLFGIGGDGEDGSKGAPGTPGQTMVTPADRTARSIDEQRTTSTSEVTIKDETGRAAVTRGRMGRALRLQQSGAM